MSLFSGIIHRDFQAVTKSELSNLHNSLKNIPQHSYKELTHKHAAFSCLHTNNDSMPVYLAEQNVLFVAQGRIDNKTELIALLGGSSSTYDVMNDEQLILEIYLTFKDDTPNKLLGDWSFAAYNFNENTLFIAQDPCGYSSVFYYIDKNVVIFSNIIKPLLSSDKVCKEIDLQKIIIRDAVITDLDKDATFYKNIKLLGPAHQLSIHANSHDKKRYWWPEKIALNHDISAEDAAEQLKSLFTEAVRCRLDDNKLNAAMLSGGLDSSSVSVIAADLLKAQQKVLHTFSHVPLFSIDNELFDQHRFGDEKPYIEEIVKHNGNITPHYITSKNMSPLQGIRIQLDALDMPIHAALNAYWLVDIYQQAKQSKFDVLLSGEMGNATISWEGVPQQGLGQNSIWFTLRNQLIRPLYRYVKSLYSKVFFIQAWQRYSYLSPEFAKQAGIKQLIAQSGRNVNFSNQYTYSEMQQRIHKFGNNPRFTFGSVFSHYFGIEKRDPTGDKRVVEFILQLPNDLFYSKTGENKNILKLMMKNLLPDKVLYQNKKGLQSADIVERVQTDLPEITSIITNFSTELTDVDMFDKKRLLNDVEKLKQKKLSIISTHHLMKTVGIMEFLNRH